MARSQKPWWRDWRQLPPGSETEGTVQPLGTVAVWLVRLLLLVELLALVVAAAFHMPAVGAPLLVGLFFVMRKLPDHQRHQVLGPLAGA
jgi:asparagine N-glycosylation enzyme membrane subunit Stt3